LGTSAGHTQTDKARYLKLEEINSTGPGISTLTHWLNTWNPESDRASSYEISWPIIECGIARHIQGRKFARWESNRTSSNIRNNFWEGLARHTQGKDSQCGIMPWEGLARHTQGKTRKVQKVCGPLQVTMTV